MSLTLLHSPGDIIRQLIIDLGLGTDPVAAGSWPVYFNSEPDTPDEAITVYHTPGQVDGRSMIDGEYYEHYGVMVRVRSTRSTLAYSKASQISVSLAESVYNQLVNISGNTYIVCALNRKGSVIPTGKESPSSEREGCTINFISAIYRTS